MVEINHKINQLASLVKKATKVYINREMECQSSFELTVQENIKDILVELEKLL
ncbi:MAG: hypothetical protein XD91_0500 [Clostridiales bacterium 38_11]|nr:MAG: hypothetical protein XD91_0500 [Clostridiales bacterium 38_11]